MASPLLNVSNSHLFWQDHAPVPVDQHHQPNLLAFPRDPKESIHDARQRLIGLLDQVGPASPDENDLAKVLDVLEPLEYGSFWNHGQKRDVIPVVSKRSYWVPDISDRLFFDHGFYTCEHDIPYTERALADLSAQKDWWTWDTKGHPAKLDVLTYDIETTQYGQRVKDIPIDVIGYSEFPVEYEASKDLDTEQFDFRFRDLPTDWEGCEVTQLVSRNVDEELDHLMEFTQHAVRYDIIAGHNILGFDNLQVRNRIQDFMQRDQRQQSMSPGMRGWFQEFLDVWSRRDRSFHFGTQSDIGIIHPVSLDTFHAARKFYFFHDDFSLKGLAPWLGIEVPDRMYIDAVDLRLDDPRTLIYNRHDICEQTGITQILLAQALPLAFAVNLPLDSLLTGGNTKMWDHMAFIRARRNRRIMPATCRAQGMAAAIHRHVRQPFPTREEVAQAALALPEEERATGNKEFVRVAKQGPEMPFWCEHPSVILRPNAAQARIDELRAEKKDILQGKAYNSFKAGRYDPKDYEIQHAAERPADIDKEITELREQAKAETSGHGYEIAGGLTLKPDSDLKSHFVPWYHVVEADVGAMYPTILKAQNLTADTVQPARKGEQVDDWIWLKDLDAGLVASDLYEVRRPNEEEDYTRGKGFMVGVRRNPEPGMVNLAMTGILDTIQKVKDARGEARRSGAAEQDMRILDMTYASLKAARNAGTHGILVAVNVSCRQFNVWGGANITTIGQKILHETRREFEKEGIRVVYGDTDGLYLGCSRSAGNLPHFAAAIDADVEPEADKWITMPNVAVGAVDAANQRWRQWLDYPEFELEAEQYDAMVYVVHKNYLKFKADKQGKFHMETKGNNFRGSDKPPLAQTLLLPIMQRALRDVASWDDEEDARERMKTAIKRATREVMKETDILEMPWSELVLRQSVQPLKSYKPNPDGSLSTFAVRTAALEQVVGEPIAATKKFQFVVCKEPLPLYQEIQAQGEARERLARQGYHLVVKKPRKSGIKPIEYMWPAQHVKDNPHMVDWVWYKEMVENYVKGAFGFDSLELAVQRDLSSWF